ncbi:MAG TPA: transposase, partial [Methylococcales bacterium]
RRTWRKLHLAINENHQVLACELTTPDVGDPTAVPDLLAQIDTPFGTFIGDGAYDGKPVSRAVLDQQPDAQVVIPPHKNAVCSDAGDTQRDQHIQAIEQHGRIALQQKTGYGLRNLVELAMQRYKRIFGNTMKARALPQQKNGSMGQCVCTQQNDGARHACVCKNLTNVRKGELMPNFDLFNNAPYCCHSSLLELITLGCNLEKKKIERFFKPGATT